MAFSKEKFNQFCIKEKISVGALLYVSDDVSEELGQVGVVMNTLQKRNDETLLAWHSFFSDKLENIVAEIARESGAKYYTDFDEDK